MKLRVEFLLLYGLTLLIHCPSASSNKTGTGRSRSHGHHHHKKLPLLRRSRIDYLLEEPDAELRRQYKLEDFLWTGSGEGPTPVDSHDGMAWEDELIHPSGTPAIKVTKTMVLYKTVLSTVYPIAMTPVVVTSNPYSTPALQSIGPTTLKPSLSLSSDEFSVPLSTPALSSAVVQPTILPTPTQASSGSEEDSLDNHYQDHLSAASTDLRYWIQTVLKAKDEEKNDHPNDMSFQESMQRKLATVYAAAFKRQLLQTLGVARRRNHEGRKNESYQRMTLRTFNSTARNRRSPTATKTAMNVTVAMMNVSWTDPIHLITLKYVVYAEGSPIPGFVAVKELNAVNIQEMERKLGYQVVTKAEALVKPIERSELGGSPTLYLVGLLILVFVMAAILAMTLFMMWKWKYNQLRSMEESSASRAERGTIRSEALPNERRNYQQSNLEQERRASIRSPASSQFRQIRDIQQPKRTTVHKDAQQGSAGSDQQLVTSDDKDSSPVRRGGLGPSSPQRSPTRYKLRHGGASRKVSKRKRRKPKLQGLQTEDNEDNSQGSADNAKERANVKGAGGQDFSLTTDLCRNLDKISYGNLEISLEPIARVPSAHAKRIIDSRPSSHEKLRASKRGEYSGHSDSQTVEDAHFPHDPVTKTEQEDDRESIHEQDRDLSEKSFEIADLDVLDTASSTQDAQVQTPTRLVKKSPRVRTTSRLKSPTKPTKISLVSTESEEATEFYHLNQQPGDELNPLGKMRKRFHQFLDDAFNVMASGKKETRVDKPQSATVTVSHKLKTKTPGRPWTSHVIREESVRKVRPKSSVVIGPPKSAWTDGSLRRCQSAKSKGSNLEEQDGGAGVDDDDEEYEILDDKFNPSPFSSRSPVPSATLTDVRQHPVPDSSKTFLFPNYPAYPEICLEDDPNRTCNPQSSRRTRTGLLPSDPATPLIAAIKNEMKRFEKVRVSSSRVLDS